jgi:predicted phage tail protein
MAVSSLTRGSGGGGGSKTPETRQPIESPNTLQARMSARVLDIIAEGQCYGLANGLKSIYFDDTPLQNSDNSFNFPGVQVFERVGTPDQPWIEGFPAVESESSVGVKVKAGPVAAVVRRINNENATAVRVTVVLASLFDQDTKTGDTRGSSIDFHIGIRRVAAGADWINYQQRIEGKTMGAYPASYRLPLPGEGPWDVRVWRLTPDSDRATLGNEMSWQSFTEIVDHKLTYSRSAVIGTIYNAEQTSNVPRRSFDYKGWLCRVPVNYDGETRTYLSNFWDGTFKWQWTDDPAWLFLQLLTHDSGADLADSQIDKWTLYEISRYCSERVPDGYGGFEPRFSANFVLNTRQEAYSCINALASCFRAMTYWESGAVQVVADMPREPDIQVSNSNTYNDAGFDYSSPDFNSVHNAVLVSFLDKDNNYEASVETVEDGDSIAQHGYNEIEITAFACTSRGQAHRLGKWLLESEKHGSEAVSYKASLEHLNASPGMIAEIADRDYAAIRIGGRIVSATTTSVTLDEPFRIDPGVSYVLRVTMPDGKLAKSNVTRPPGTYTNITVNPPLPAAPTMHAQWAMLATNLEPRQFKIMGVSETNPLEFDVAALIHDPTKFARVEQGINISRPPTTRLPNPGIISPPGNVNVTREYVSNGGGFVESLQVTWDASSDPYVRGYVVSYQKNRGPWQRRPEVPSTVDTIYGEGPGFYVFHVQAVNFASVFSRPSVLEVNILNESPITLLKPTGLQLDGQGNNTQFTGRDPKFTWRATAIRGAYPMGEEPASGAGYLDHIFRDFEIRVTAPNGAVVFVDHTTLTTYTFSFEKNFQTVGGPHRAFKFTVYMRDIWGNLSRPADLEVANPPPALPLALSVRGGFQAIFVSFERPTDPDFEGTLIWAHTTSGYQPGVQYLIYDGPDTFKSLNAPQNTKQYVRLAAYDSFGKTGLNMSPEFEVLVSGVVEVDFLPPAVPTGLVLSDYVRTAEDGTKHYTLRAEWTANSEADLSQYGVGIAEPGGGFVYFVNDQPSYEWEVLAGVTYRVQLRARDRFGNISIWGPEVSHTVAGDTEAPAIPATLLATAAFKTAWLQWEPHPAPDFSHMEVWESFSNDRSLSTNTALATGTSFTREALTGGTDVWYWIRAVDRSGNKSGFFPASPTAGVHARTRKVEEADYAELSIGSAAIMNAAIDDAKIASLDAGKIIAGSILSGSVIIGGTGSTLADATAGTTDPAAIINKPGSTKLLPGSISISGATTLQSLLHGGDNTQIDGGKIAANTITANSLAIGLRNLEFVGVEFTPIKETNSVTWTAGHVVYQGDDGQPRTEAIPAGSAAFDGIMYFVWNPGRGRIDATNDSSVFGVKDWVVIGQYYGGSGLLMTYGRTIIDGQGVRAGSITADRIGARQINASHLTVSEVLIANEAQIGFGAITDFHFGNGKIDGARINSLDAGRITSGSIQSQWIDVGDRNDGGGFITIESRFGYRHLAYYDQNNIQRVVLGRPNPNPNPLFDGLYVRDMAGKNILTANGLGVEIVGTGNIVGGAVTAARFENTHTLGTTSIAGGTIHIVITMSANIGRNIYSEEVFDFVAIHQSFPVRVLLNGNVIDNLSMGGAGGSFVVVPYTMMVSYAPGTPVSVQAQLNSGVGWVPFGSSGVNGVTVTEPRCQIAAIEYKR